MLTAQQSRGSNLSAAAEQLKRFVLGNLINDFLNRERGCCLKKQTVKRDLAGNAPSGSVSISRQKGPSCFPAKLRD